MKKAKILISLFLAAIMALSMFSICASAEETLAATGQCGENVYWKFNKNIGELVISGKGEMYEYFDEQGNNGPFSGNTDIKSIRIENGITKIGKHIFRGCSNLKSVYFSDSIESIEDGAFFFSSIESVNIPKNVKKIGKSAFPAGASYIKVSPDNKVYDSRNDCNAIIETKTNKLILGCNNTVIPNSVKIIGENSFNRSRIKSVDFPSSVETIEYEAFYECHELSKIVFHEGLKTIGDCSFFWCNNENLTELAIPGSVTYLGKYAFHKCYGLKTVVLGDGITRIEEDCFFECSSLKKLVIPRSVEFIYTSSPIGNFTSIVEKKPSLTIYCYKDSYAHKFAVSHSDMYKYSLLNETSISAPTVTASNVASSGKNKLTWNAVDGAASYKVYRATSKSGTYKLMKTTSSTSYVNTSAVAGQTYYYKVKAVAADGTSSKYSSVVTRTCDLPRPVVTASNVSTSGKIKLKWDKVEGATSYKVYRATSKSGTYKLMKTTTSTSYTNTSATAGKTYYYKVKAVCSNSAADSAYSAIKTRTCDLAKPTNVQLYFNSTGKPVVKWDRVEGATSYKVYRATSQNGTYKLMKTTSSTSYTNTSVSHGTTYYYKVKAICSNSAADSAYGAVVSGYVK